MAKQVEFVAHSAKVKCDQSVADVQIEMIATDNTEIGNNLLITKKDTSPISFDGNFGACKRRNGMPCIMDGFYVEWFDPNENFVTPDGTPVITMDSILICMTGGGAIRPVTSGQESENVSWLDKTPLELIGEAWGKYKQWREKQDDKILMLNIEQAKRFAEMSNINPDDPKYTEFIIRQVYLQEEAMSIAMGVSGSIKGVSAAAKSGIKISGKIVDINVKPTVSNPKMQNIINDIYKGQGGANTIGNGTTMDAVRNEIKTGLPTNGKFHSVKAQETINRLQRRLRAKDLTTTEIDITNELIKDLQNALNGK